MGNKIKLKVKKYKWADEVEAMEQEKKSNIIKTILIIILIVIIGGAAFGIGYYQGTSSSYASIDTSVATSKFKAILSLMEQNWYFGKDHENLEDDLVDSALYGMTEQDEDLHTSYMSSDEIDEFFASIDNNIVGIGVTVKSSDGYLIVQYVYKNSPAEEYGLEEGDIITTVDGDDIKGMEIDDVVALIRGEANTPVKIGILRENEPMEMTIVRQEVNTTVSGEILNDHIAYIGLTSFGSNTCDQLISYLDDMINCDDLIIDLRNNGGGHLEAVVDIASLFTENGDVVLQQEDKDGGITLYKSSGTRKYEYDHIVVLINSNTASASEVLTLALKENLDNVTLIGQKSYGKGTIQSTVYLTDGSALKYTTAKWNSPDGENINLEGIEPDYVIEYPAIVTSEYKSMEDDESYGYDSVSGYVSQLQNGLEYLGYSVDRTDGYFSKETETALKQFESDNELTVDGIFNQNDNTALLSQLSVKASLDESDLDLQKALAILDEE